MSNLEKSAFGLAMIAAVFFLGLFALAGALAWEGRI